MTEPRHFDSIVIGSGQSGGPLSTDLVASGRRTALIEREYIGGTCINVGCTPTKTMIASARVAYLDRRSADYGVASGAVSVDMQSVVRRKRSIVTSFREGSTRSIEAGGVEIVRGTARFSGPGSVRVDLNDGPTIELTAKEFFIDTGGRPARPPIEGLDAVTSYDSTSIMELDVVPEHLLVLGGGYVGLEFGQMFRRFGSKVTIVQQGPKLLGREDPDIADLVAEITREDGIDILLDSRVTGVGASGGGGVDLEVTNADGNRCVAGSHLLVAVGRVPNSDYLDGGAAGVALDDRGYVRVNERLETTAPNIWAMGDVAGSPPFTHMSYDDYRIVRDNLLHDGNRTTTDRLVPYTVFIDPQLGRVGLGEEEARQKGKHVKVARLPMSHVARAIEVDEQRGMVKAVVDADTDQILGAAALALEGGEIMAMFEIAMMGRVPYTALKEGIFAHPTLAELMNRLFENFGE